MFVEIISDNAVKNALSIMHESFATVAVEFHLTRDNAPTNPAFMTIEKLKAVLAGGVKLFGLIHNGRLTGTVGIEQSKDDGSAYYIEYLAVVPGDRHSGLGKRLMDHAVKEIAKLGGAKASVEIINQNTRLKSWYVRYGFKETRVKKYDHLPFEVCFLEFVLPAAAEAEQTVRPEVSED